jgi:methyl-accepting chemotaxis protein
MFNTLRNRLILSNILPLLVIIPLMRIALIYVLENQYLLPKLSEELTADTRLLDSFASTDPTIWMNSTNAQTFLNRVKSYPTRHIMLISSDGNILASSDPADANRLNQALDINGLKEAQKGIEVQRLNYITSLHSQAIDIFSPVIGSNHQVIGIIRLAYPYENIYVEFTQTRFLIIGILIIGLLTGTILGLILALNIGKPIQKVTEAVYNLAGGDHSQQLTEQGPEETRLLLRAVNFLTAQLSSLE